MSETMLTIVAIALMIVLFVILIWGKISPVIAMTLLPIAACIICGFPLSDVGEWVTAGLKSQVSTVAMFVFAIIFFSCIMDTGVFDTILGRLLGNAKNVTMVCLMTVFATMLGHLDGSGATTFLLVIPPLSIIYRKMNIRPVVLMGLTAMTAGIMNMLPWGGPCARVAIGLELTPNEIFLAALPGFVVGLICMFALAFFMARREIKRGAGIPEGTNMRSLLSNELSSDAEKVALARPKLFWFNLVLVIVTIVLTFTLKVPTALVFAVAAGIALMVNYPGAKAQAERMKAYAPSCMTMVTIGLAAGIYSGIFTNSALQSAMSNSITSLVSSGAVAHLNSLMGYLWAPLTTVGLNHEATVYTIIPTIANICSDFVTPAQVGATYLMTYVTRTFANPLTAAMFVGLGLSGVDMKEHLRFTLPWALLISTVIISVVLLFGFLPF